MLQPAAPIETIDLFPPLHDQLLTLLRQLPAEDWLKPTPVPGWSVKDTVAHLLDTSMRRISAHRDGFQPASATPPPASYHELVALLNQLNAEWVVAARRISPTLLVELLALIEPQVYQLLRSRNPLDSARVSVAWAGEQHSLHWFDVAREYTEKWHHQQHIREAIGAPLLTSRMWLHPALDTFMRGLPAIYRDLAAPTGSQVVIAITGEAGGEWTLLKHEQHWQLYWGAASDSTARVQIDQEHAWRLFTNGIQPAVARSALLLEGDHALGIQVLSLLAIMAEREEASSMHLTGLDHLQLAMPQGAEASARAFYGALLGLREIEKPPELQARGGCWFNGPGFQIHLGVESEFRPAQKAHPAFLVVDIAAYQQHLENAGVRVIPDTTIPTVRRFYASDPFGNRLEFIQQGQGFR